MLLFFYNNLFSQELIPNDLGFKSLIGKINSQIEQKKLLENVKFYLNNEEINLDELIVLNKLKPTEIIDIEFYDVTNAVNKYGENVTGGAVNIVPFIDEALSSKYYYSIQNKRVLETIETLVENKQVKINPIIVLNGKPLRGEDISIKINEIEVDSIESINQLDKIKGYEIYGIRAIPGVIIITTK